LSLSQLKLETGKLTMIETAIKKVANNENLTFNEAESVMDEIMNGKTNDIQISSYLTALSMKKETVAEIAGSAKAMRDHALPFNAGEEVLEIVGTGGDHANTFNISSTSAIVVAAAGVPVAKHGNRAASSKSGAADVLESLGININLAPDQSEQLLQQVGFSFMFRTGVSPSNALCNANPQNARHSNRL
jgi:anthranilate phosphoribosyltransferase